MSLSVDTHEALDLKNFTLPPGLRILSLEAEDYTDWTGDDALRVSILLDEETDVVEMSGAIGDFEMAVVDRLREYGIKLFPYFFIAKPSELAEVDEEE